MFFAYVGGCGTEELEATLTLTQEQWSDVWISEDSTLMKTTGTNSDFITKHFLLKVGPEFSDRVAFYFPGYLNIKPEELNVSIGKCP